MGFKSIERKRQYDRLRIKKIREQNRVVVPDVVPVVVPDVVPVVVPDVVPVVVPVVVPDEIIPDPFIYDIMRFELLFDTIQMRELLSRKTRFNAWMDKQMDVLDEIKEYHK